MTIYLPEHPLPKSANPIPLVFGGWQTPPTGGVEQWLGFSVDEIGRCKPAQECRCGHNRVRPADKATGDPRGHVLGCTSCSCTGFDPWQVNVWPLIDLGYVYLAQPPLYRLKWSNSPHEYVYSDRERDALIAHGSATNKRMPKENGIQRYKGLGEMDYKELWETTMDPATRTLLQVTLDDAAQADEVFSVLMGEDVVLRRGFIQRNAKDVRFLDI